MRNRQIAIHRRLDRFARLLAPLCLAAAVTAVAAGPTFAVGNNGPDITVAGFGATATVYVGCDAVNHSMTVSAKATTFQSMGLYGPVVGPYDAGQWIRYNVWAREINASEYTPVYTWSSWQWITSLSSTMYIERMISAQDLGTNVVNGAAGHGYEVKVQVDWWTGAENVVDVQPTYSQTYTSDPFNTWYLQPGYCHL